MFKVARKRTVKWPVTVSIPQDQGKTTKATFTAEFELLDQQRIDDIVMGRDPEQPDLLAAALIGWEGVADEAGNELPFTPENKRALLEITYVRTAILVAHAQLHRGEAARKN
jgi:hypothetical protein